MYIVKNALKSICRSKGRNILIGIIVLVIAASSCISLAIRNSAKEVVNQQKENYAIKATIGVDRQAIMQQASSSGSDMKTIMESASAISVDNLKKYADSQYVKSLTYQESVSLDSDDIDSVSNSTTNSSSSSTSSSSNKNNQQNDRGPGGMMKEEGTFRLVGYSSQEAMQNFVDGTYKISSGEMFADTDTANDCVITDELASENSLKVGDSITFKNPKNDDQTATFKIVGIYKDTSASTEDGSAMNLFSNSANQIITNYTAVHKIYTDSTASEDTTLRNNLTSSFTLKSADVVDAFTKELRTKGLADLYTVTTNSESFEQTVAPLNNLIKFSTIFLILVLAIGSIILVVLNMFNIRERKYEVGVLRAIGMKKGKVAMQFITELFIVTFAFLIIGTAAGGAASVPVAKYMLQTEISQQESQQQQVQQNFGKGGQPGAMNGQGRGEMIGHGGGIGGMFGTQKNVSYVNQINAVINGKVILEIAGIGILLTILSSGISLIFISRYEPLKILSSRT